ncbi:hypothetical protein H8959_014153 [Pygathrix nigripes]
MQDPEGPRNVLNDKQHGLKFRKSQQKDVEKRFLKKAFISLMILEIRDLPRKRYLGREKVKMSSVDNQTVISERYREDQQLFRSQSAGQAEVLVRRGTIPRSCVAGAGRNSRDSRGSPCRRRRRQQQQQPQDRPRQVDQAE